MLGSSLITTALALTGCSTPPAKDFAGKWKPVNRFSAQPTEIPLRAAYTFYAAPMDETLKTMLSRWAKDSGRTLSYQLPFDVTLFTPVSDIRTSELGEAAKQLTSIYAAQHVYVTATDLKILVLPSSTTTRDTPDMTAPRSPSSKRTGSR